CHLTILPYASRLFSCSLLCTRSGAPRDLHSFPTRRSSDLRRAPVFQIADGVEDAPADLAIGRACAIGAMLLKGADGYAEEARGLDRKSTRLNSSHVKISYAVFCLKKKKKTMHTQRRPTTEA